MVSPHELAKRCLFGTWSWTVHIALRVYKTFIQHIMDTKQRKPEAITGDECQRTEGPPETRASCGLRYGSGMEDNEDTVDLPVTRAVKQALEKVSGAIYKVCFSGWHQPPEKMEEQPLYKELHVVIESVFTNIRAKSRPTEVYEILLGVTNAITVHLKSFRKNRVKYTYNSPEEEVAFLRQQTRCLLQYWLPDSLRNSDTILVFLNEILSINVLRPAIDNFSDVKVINETVVRILGNGAPEKRDGLDQYSRNVEPVCCRPLQAASKNMERHSFLPSKQERKGYVRKRNEGTEKNRKHRELDSDLGFRSYSRAQEEDTVDSVGTELFNLDDGGSDDNNDLTTSISDTVLQRWRQESWTAICENAMDKDIFKIHVCNMNTKLWITERTSQNFKQIYEILATNYQVFNKLNENEEETDFFQAIDTTPDMFIDILLKIIKDHQEPEAIFFLSPFKYEEESRELFNNILSDNYEDFTTDESKTDESDEDSDEAASDSNGSYESDGFRGLKVLKRKKKHKNDKKNSSSEPDISCDEIVLKYTATSSHNLTSSIQCPSVSTDEPEVRKRNYNLQQTAYLNMNKEQNNQRKNLEDTLLNAMYCLFDELFAGGRSIFAFLNSMGLLNEIKKYTLDNIPQLYTEDQIVWYLNQASELLLSTVDPLSYTPPELHSQAQELLKTKLKSVLMNKVAKYLFEKKILNSITASLEAFQCQKANKEIIYGLLEDLTRIIVKDSQERKSD